MTRTKLFSGKNILIGAALLLVLAILIIFINRGGQKTDLKNPTSKDMAEAPKVVPSETYIDYSDPSGFSFSYPDNLSLTKNDEVDNNTYADIQLYAKGVNGSLSLNISDTKLKTLEEWLKQNQISSKVTPKEVKLGSLKALEVKTTDRLMLGAIDQGILFTVEMPLIEEDFWMKVYGKVVSDFAFNSPASQNISGGGEASSSDGISFEGEEVVE